MGKDGYGDVRRVRGKVVAGMEGSVRGEEAVEK